MCCWVSAPCRLFRALLLIKIHTLWQNNFKAKSSQAVCDAQQNPQNCSSVEQNCSLIRKWWHIWAVLALLLPKTQKNKAGIDFFVVSWSDCALPAALEISLTVILSSLSSAEPHRDLKKLKLFIELLLFSQAKARQCDPGVNARIRHLRWRMMSLFPWCTLTVAQTLRVSWPSR